MLIAKTDSPFLSDLELPIASQPGVGTCKPFFLHSGMLAGKILSRSCAGNHSAMRSWVPQSCHVLPNLWPLNISAHSFPVFPEPWWRGSDTHVPFVSQGPSVTWFLCFGQLWVSAFNTVHCTEKVRTESLILCQFSKIVGSPLVPKRPTVLGSRSVNSSRHVFSSMCQGVHLSREHLLTPDNLCTKVIPTVGVRISSWQVCLYCSSQG